MNTISIPSMAAFIRRNLPDAFSASNRRKRENVTNWLSWHIRGKDVCVLTDNGKITGLGVAKAISNEKDAGMNYRCDENGHILYVLVAVSTKPEGLKTLLQYCKFRWPHCTKIMFNRKKYGKRSMYDYNKFMRKAG
jgi:hypothetical protein